MDDLVLVVDPVSFFIGNVAVSYGALGHIVLLCTNEKRGSQQKHRFPEPYVCRSAQNAKGAERWRVTAVGGPAWRSPRRRMHGEGGILLFASFGAAAAPSKGSRPS